MKNSRKFRGVIAIDLEIPDDDIYKTVGNYHQQLEFWAAEIEKAIPYVVGTLTDMNERRSSSLNELKDNYDGHIVLKKVSSTSRPKKAAG